jgi:diaminopimelate decarboxylase
MNIDQLRESVSLPPMKKGDNVVISRIGAYNMTQWMQFITLRPRVVMIDTKRNVHVIRNNETNASVTSLEKMPEYLKLNK